MSFSTIDEYNTNLINKYTKITLKDYITNIKQLLDYKLNIEFMDYFLELCKHKNEFIIDHVKLQEYKVINTIKSSDILRCIEQYNLVNNIDYQIIEQQSQRGGLNMKTYMLTPKAFKICLMRSRNTLEYAEYYIFLEECISYYNTYETELKNKLLSMKDEKIDNLEKQINEMIGISKNLITSNNQMEKKIDVLVTVNSDLVVNNNILEDEIIETRNIFEEGVKEIQTTITEHLRTNNIDPDNIELHHQFTLLQHPDNKNEFKFIRGQLRHVNNKIVGEYSGYTNIINQSYNSNPIDLFNRLKEFIKNMHKYDRNQIKERYRNREINRDEKDRLLYEYNNNLPINCHYNTIINNTIPLEMLIQIINQLDNKKYNITFPYPNLPIRE